MALPPAAATSAEPAGLPDLPAYSSPVPIPSYEEATRNDEKIKKADSDLSLGPPPSYSQAVQESNF